MDEVAIIRHCQEKDMNAFNVLYERYAMKTVRTAFLITGHRQLAEDIVQETFVQCYTSIHKLKDPEKFQTWLYKILVRNCWHFLSKEKKKYRTDFLDDAMEEQLKDPINLYERIDTSDEYLELHRAIDQLSDPLREVIVLFYFNDLSIKEISIVLDCFENTVKTRLHKARKKLEKDIGATFRSEQKAGEINEGVRFI